MKILKHIFKRGPKAVPKIGRIDFGDFNRLKPFSDDWGFGRGGAVDRYYIEGFLAKNKEAIQGRALEIKDDQYLKKFGGPSVHTRDILDIDAQNPLATIVADIAKAGHLPADTYDCIVLTQTLQLVFDLKSAVHHLYRILKPGGVLLLTVPGISHFPSHTRRYWSFTEHSVRALLEEKFAQDKILVEKHGNVLVTASFLYSIGTPELSQEIFDYQDPDYQLIITARAVK